MEVEGIEGAPLQLVLRLIHCVQKGVLHFELIFSLLYRFVHIFTCFPAIKSAVHHALWLDQLEVKTLIHLKRISDLLG